MSWDTRLVAAGDPLTESIDHLFEDQVAAWPLLRAGAEGLENTRSRTIVVDGFELKAAHIPHRIRSTTAAVDDQSVRQRPCFLCEENLPAEERAVSFGAGFFVTCNPFPILPRHVSIVSREHRPQRAEPDFSTMLALAGALPDYLVLYNGGECGASAPDHMHFQACRRAGVPVMAYLGAAAGGIIEGYPVGHVLLSGTDATALTGKFNELMARLVGRVQGRHEPMVNVVAVWDAGVWSVLVFPRRRHRPSVFASGELIWSPGALDLAGILVLPRREDLERITPDRVRAGFSEVSAGPKVLGQLAAELELR